MRKRKTSHATIPFRIYVIFFFVAKAAISGTRPETGLDIDAKRNGSHAVTPFRIYVNSSFDGRASIA